MFKEGFRVSPVPHCPELRRKYSDLPQNGDVAGIIVKLPDSYYRGVIRNPSVPVKIEGFYNRRSLNGSYWFKLSSLQICIPSPESIDHLSYESNKNESEEITMLNVPTIKEKFCPITCTVYVPNSSRTVRDKFALYPDLYDSISVGDTVVVHHDELGEALIADVLEIDTMGNHTPLRNGKEVICKVDFQQFKSRHANREKVNSLFQQMQEIAQNISFLSFFEGLADKSPEMKNLLEEYKSLTSGGEE